MPVSASFAMRIMAGLLAAIFAATAIASSRKRSRGTTRSIAPRRSASAASIISPVKNR